MRSIAFLVSSLPMEEAFMKSAFVLEYHLAIVIINDYSTFSVQLILLPLAFPVVARRILCLNAEAIAVIIAKVPIVCQIILIRVLEEALTVAQATEPLAFVVRAVRVKASAMSMF